MGSLELTFAILKPHLVENPTFFNSVRNLILTSNFEIVQSKRHLITLKEAELFYQEHKEKFFYNRLVSFMISGPSQLYILAREDGIKMWRQLMGPTKVFKTIFEAPDTIRGQFGLSDTRNATHGSDSPNSVKFEASVFFPNFSIEDWYKSQEERWRNVERVNYSKDNSFAHHQLLNKLN